MRPGKNILLCAALGLLALGLSTSVAVELTLDNYAELTAGKSVLLKLYAPWCTHCKAIKPAWDALMKQYEGHADVLVGESDCTAAGKTLCEDLQVQVYPTLKYGDPTSLTDYQGARDLDGLKRFADSELRPACSLSAFSAPWPPRSSPPFCPRATPRGSRLWKPSGTEFDFG